MGVDYQSEMKTKAEDIKVERNLKEDVVDQKAFKTEVVWGNVIKFIILHGVALVGIISLPFVNWRTLVFHQVLYLYAALGITAGAHRLWAHRSYKVALPLRVFLMFANCMAAQNSVYVWVRDHRAHHKYSETDADPHNANRGFFFAHMGWLLCRKHSEVIRNGSKIDISDIWNDPVLRFQHKCYTPLSILWCFVLPTFIPVYFWGENAWLCYCVCVFRYVFSLHATWLVNSAAHLWGSKPYDVNIQPVENRLVSFFAVGEGFHNYHHTFPQDYSVSEWRYTLNFTTLFIDAMAWLGQVQDRKSMSRETITNRIARTGPNSKTKIILEKDY